MLVSEGHAATEARLIWVAYIANWSHSDMHAWVVAGEHAWVCSSTLVLMFVACVDTKGHRDTSVLDQHM